jgi:hypothetical protein
MNHVEFRRASLSDYSALLRLFETRQPEMVNDVQQRLRDAREERRRTHEVSDTADTSEVDARPVVVSRRVGVAALIGQTATQMTNRARVLTNHFPKETPCPDVAIS